ncbi:MAG: SUMF1/EgtB/PvdO family nonheme iron enzyme [Planctomycetota bacterium]
MSVSRRAARQQIEDRQKKLREELADAQQKLSVGKESLARLSDAAPEQFSQHRDVVRGQLAEAQKAFGQVEAGNAEAESALKTLRKLENELEVRHFLHKARMFLSPPKVRPGEAQELPNYAGAEFAAQEAADRDPGNTEAKELLILAKGTRAVAIETEGSPAEVFAKRIVDVTGRQLSSVPGLGLPLGRTPVKGSKLEPGLYLISFKCAGLVGRVGNPPYEVQQATLLVTRDAKDEDLRLRITVNAPEENMVLIPAGNVTLPQHGSVAVPPFAIDRFEYPNKAGTVPATGLSLVDVQALCKKQGKALCNPGQWLRACMGDGERRYPYGAAYLSRACATGFDFEAQKQPLPSGLFARCRTPEGVYDMSGNVAEWTDTTEQENTFGGDWTSSTRVADLTVSCWARSPHDEVGPDRLGFRCCKGK